MIQYNIATLTKRQTESSVVEITDIHKACRTGDLSTIKHAYHLDPSPSTPRTRTWVGRRFSAQ